MATDTRLPVVALFATLIALTGFLAFTIYSPTIYIPPGIVVSAQYDKFQNPGGPTLIITIQTSVQSQPITQVSATVKHSLGPFAFEGFPDTYYHTLEFSSVTEINPLSPGGWVSQKYGWVGPSIMDDNLTISGTLADGSKFSVETTINWV